MLRTILTIALISLASQAQAYEENNIEKQIKRNIDNICGDTFCEGEYNYAFHKLIIKGNTALLYYDELNSTWVKKENDTRYTEIINATSAICPLNPFVAENELVEITENLMIQLSNCVDNPILLDELPK